MTYLLWSIIGVATAGILLVFQYLSVKFISSNKPSMSQVLILGGAFIRLFVIAIILYYALSTSLSALLSCFAALIFSQLLFLFIWDHKLGRTNIKNQLINEDI